MAQVTGKGSIIAQEKPEKTCQKWQLRVSIGRDFVSNKYITKTRRFEGTKTEAQKELRAFINELESGIRTDTTTLTFAEFANRWQQERAMSGDYAKNTLNKGDLHIRNMNPYIGNVLLSDISPETVSSLYIMLKNGGSVSGNQLLAQPCTV